MQNFLASSKFYWFLYKKNVLKKRLSVNEQIQMEKISYGNYLNEHRGAHLIFYLSERGPIRRGRRGGSFKPGRSLKNAK